MSYNDADRNNIITDLYGSPDSAIKAIFDQRLGADKPDEIVQYGAEKIYAGDKEMGMRESRVNRTLIRQLKERIQLNNPDYIDEKNRH